MSIVNHVSLTQKLAILAIGLFCPAVYYGYQSLEAASANASTARHELQGARYINALTYVLAEISRHRGQTGAFINGEESFREAALATEARLEGVVAKMDAMDTELAEKLTVTGRWALIKSEWFALKGRVWGLTSAAETYRQHAVVLDDIVRLVDLARENSELSLDPVASTYHLQAVTSTLGFNALEQIIGLRGAVTSAAAHGTASPADLIEIYVHRDSVPLALRKVQLELERAWATSEKMKAALAPLLRSLNEAEGALTTLVFERMVVPGSGNKVSSREAFEAGDAAASALLALTDRANSELLAQLQQRTDALQRQFYISIAVGLSIVGIGILLIGFVARSLTKPMARAIEIFESIAGGRYDNSIGQAGTDEAGQVLRALDGMQGKLKDQIATERSQAAQTARIKIALDKASASIMLADANGDIIYLNESAARLVRDKESDFEREFPALDRNHIVGHNTDVFQKIEALQRSVLAGLRETRTADASVGDSAIRIAASPVVAADGARMGTVVEWFDRTQEVHAQVEVANIVRKAIAGDLTTRLRTDNKTEFFKALSRGLNELLENVSSMVEQIKLAASEVHRGADEISAGNMNLSQQTEEQAASLKQTASSIEEMASVVKRNADSAGHAYQLATAACDQAEKGGVVVAQAVESMGRINESSNRIADIIGTIDEIAFQTNLLALNAAVEAARAGEQGRGFGVVAAEVRNLAGRSATAAKEIKKLIQDSVAKVQDGSALVTQSGCTLERIVSSVKKVSDIIGEIAAASREQSLGIEQVNKAVMQMDEMTQQNAALVEEASAASQDMADQARALTQTMGRYRVNGGIASNDESGVKSGLAVSVVPRSSGAKTKPLAPRSDRRTGARPWVAGRPDF